MARLKTNNILEFYGKIGTVVAKKRYGKVFLSTAPSFYTANKTGASRKNRRVFSRRQRFNASLRKNDTIVDLWTYFKANGLNDNTRLMKRNTPFVTYECVLPGAGFTPYSDNKIQVNNLKLVDYNITFDYKLIRKNSRALKLPYDIYCLLVSDRYYNIEENTVVRRPDILVFSKYNHIEKECASSELNADFNFDSVSKSIIKAHKLYVMVAVIKLKQGKQKFEWSDTHFEELPSQLTEELKEALKTMKNKNRD